MLAMTPVSISETAKEALGSNKRVDIVSPFEICPSTHTICKDHNSTISLTFSKTKKIPRDFRSDSPCLKFGLNRYKVTCKDCKEKLVEVYAKDKSLKNWSGLRYYSWHDDKSWQGTFGINTKDDLLKLECCCSIGDRKTAKDFNIKEIK